jgi:CRISPR-associated protein Cas1
VHQLLNTLYVQTPRSYLHLDGETLKVKVERNLKLQVPLHHLGGVVCIGDVGLSMPLLQRCAEDGRAVVFLSAAGRFKARVEGPVSGNVLLRQAQHTALADPAQTLALARTFVAAKLQNTRQVLLRGGREAADPADASPLQELARHIAETLPRLEVAADLDVVRGIEGDAARRYFDVFTHMAKEDREGFALNGRTRRPPRDRANALLSFMYTLVTADCGAACEGVGLDPQVGYLHALRPGRPALALDFVEEFRAVMADRLALTLINRRQLTRSDFQDHSGGGVTLTTDGRKAVVVAYQQRKQEELTHPFTGEKTPLGLVPHVQARLLARFLRGDILAYPPFLYR